MRDFPQTTNAHRWPLTAQAWQAQVPVLQAAGYRVVTYDRRGFGHSDKPDSDISGAPHGLNVSYAHAFNEALLNFWKL